MRDDSFKAPRQITKGGLYRMGAGTSGACLRCKQHPTGRNQAQPAPTSNTLKLTALVGDQIPHAVGVVPKEHGVVAG